jgi:hypothetical protein
MRGGWISSTSQSGTTSPQPINDDDLEKKDNNHEPAADRRARQRDSRHPTRLGTVGHRTLRPSRKRVRLALQRCGAGDAAVRCIRRHNLRVCLLDDTTWREECDLCGLPRGRCETRREWEIGHGVPDPHEVETIEDAERNKAAEETCYDSTISGKQKKTGPPSTCAAQAG